MRLPVIGTLMRYERASTLFKEATMYENKTSSLTLCDTDNAPAVIGYVLSSLFGAIVGFVIGILV